MESNWAIDHIQVIRTLMERSTLYRRALAPVMLISGVIGTASALVSRFVPLDTNTRFALFWLAVGIVTIFAALLLVRRQALKEAEPFWSVPTRRVIQALVTR